MTLKNATLIGEAQKFALQRHGNQRHGSLHIKDHLEDVAQHVATHYNDYICNRDMDDVVAAAYLHDVMEDTKTTLDELEAQFPETVTSLVTLLTDKHGRSRIERHLRTYHAIRQDNDALLIKLCDRRHNHARSLKHGEHWLAMYEREYNYFKFALWTPGKFEALWSELDEQHERMKRMMSW